MPIDPAVALGTPLPELDVRWTSSDVLLYHLALGAGTPPSDQRELRYACERDLQVLPTFGVVVPTLGRTQAPAVVSPGIDIDLARVLHGGQEITAHRPIPVQGTARALSRVTAIYDKGTAAVIVTETVVTDPSGQLLWTARSSVFARGEGGFGGDRGPATTATEQDRPPDKVILTPTLPQQALWYRLLGDRNPLHSDPEFAAAAGFPAPILHGLGTYGIVCKAVVDAMLEGDVSRVATFGTRFAGVVFPGESLRTAVWRDGDRLSITTTVPERDGAPALTDAFLELTS